MLFICRFAYGWSIPICGSSAADSNFPSTSPSTGVRYFPKMSFSVSTIWQWNYNYGSGYAYLGLYNSSSWVFGQYNKAFALGFSNYGGELCGSSPRRSTVYLQCNRQHNVTNPKIVSKEISTCVCKSFIVCYCDLLLHRYSDTCMS